MGSSIDSIADYAHALRFADLPAAAVTHCKRCMVDTFGVALGAFDAEPSRIAREMAQRVERALDAVWHLDTAANLDVVFEAVRIGG